MRRPHCRRGGRSRRTGLAALGCAACLLLSSCNAFGGDLFSLLSPPRLSQQQKEIETALADALGEREIVYVYPPNGATSSAITLRDVCGDARDEAVVLYKIGQDSLDARIAVLTQNTDNVWTLACDIAPALGGIDRVEFVRFSGTGKEQLAVGWLRYSGDTMLQVYSVDAAGAHELLPAADQPGALRYSAFLPCDVLRDGTAALFVVQSGGSQESPTASLVEYGVAPNAESYLTRQEDGSGSYLLSSVPLRGNPSQYLQVQFSATADGTPVLYLDEQEGNSVYSTEILYFYDDTLWLLFDNPPQRTTPVLCRDANGDGQIEVPLETALPGYSTQANASKMYSFRWMSFSAAAVGQERCRTVINTTWMYEVVLPEDWWDGVTVQTEDGDRVWTFLSWDQQANVPGDPILVVRAWVDDGWTADARQIRLATSGNVTFTVELLQPELLPEKEMQSMFRLYAE